VTLTEWYCCDGKQGQVKIHSRKVSIRERTLLRRVFCVVWWLRQVNVVNGAGRRDALTLYRNSKRASDVTPTTTTRARNYCASTSGASLAIGSSLTPSLQTRNRSNVCNVSMRMHGE
jgi:hypothetical protein